MHPEYHKIDTVFKRDPETKFKTLLEGEYSRPEFEYLARNQWEFTEKVDGTNIRVMVTPGGVTFGGKTDRAQIPPHLMGALDETFLPRAGTLAEMFKDGAVLYGEGYGAKIQKGGGNYRADQGFVLFDVLVGPWWLRRKDVLDVAAGLGIEAVPIIGHGTLADMVQQTREGFASQWGDFQAEGIVARPSVELIGRDGRRIITKIKHRDFPEG